MINKVTAIVITYNAIDDLKECLKSLERQDYKDLEIIVVNDASTDETEDFLTDYKSRINNKVIVINNETNQGVAGARNVGIKLASGDIIAFTDADCIVDKSWISELVKGYINKNIAVVGGSISDGPLNNIWELSEKGHDFVASQEGYVPFIKGCNMSFRSDVLKTFMFNTEIKYGYEEILLSDFLIDIGFKIYFRPQSIVWHKHRRDFISLSKQKYQRGKSSVWYLMKRNKFFMYKRHFLLLVALLMVPFLSINILIFIFFLTIFSIFSFSLLREEIAFNTKSVKEIIITFPFIVFIEFIHFAGSCAGVFIFRVLRKGS